MDGAVSQFILTLLQWYPSGGEVQCPLGPKAERVDVAVRGNAELIV